ncbi:MAG: ABC transporter ATP-binding protein [Erysipelotrichaceae bacterium]
MIEIKNLSKSFNGKTKAVDNISFCLEPNEIVGFIGPNGAGKTTTIKMLAGILKKDSGSIVVNDIDIDKNPLGVKQQLGVVMDNPDIFLRLTGIEYLNFMADLYDIDQATRVERIHRFASALELESALGDKIVSYSHGMRQKIVLIGVLICNPSLWILDEPLTGLDPQSAFVLKNLMKEHVSNGNSVFFSTHVLEVAEKLCDRIMIINHGTIIFEGTLEQLKALHPDKNNLEELFLKVTQDA